MAKAPRSDYRLPDASAVQILVEILRATHDARTHGDALYDVRRYAGLILDHLAARAVSLHAYPKVLPLREGDGQPRTVSGPATRTAACEAWDIVERGTGSAAKAFGAAVETTLRLEPSWTVEDAALHTIRFVVPPDQRRR
jgi:hypothetical protein